MKAKLLRTIASHAGFLLLLLFAWPSSAQERRATPQPQVLVLVSYQFGLPVPYNFTRGVLASLKEHGIDASSVYVEHLDLVRNRDPEYRRKLAALLHEKLDGRTISLIIGLGQPVQKFLQEEGRGLFPSVPLLLNLGSSVIDWRGASRKLAVYSSTMNVVGTLRHALQLLPKTRRVLVVLGRDSEMIAESTLEQLAQFAGGLAIESTADLSYADMMRRVATLPPDTIVLNPTYFGDKFGHDTIPAEVSRKLAAQANAPVFVLYDIMVGNGVVGGLVLKSEAIGSTIGGLAGEVLMRGKGLSDTPSVVPIEHVPMYDWIALTRWGIDPDSLPHDAVVINRPQTIWTQYKGYVIGAGLVFFAMLVSLLLLLRQNRLRRLAEMAARDSEERFRVLVEHAPEAILLIDVERQQLIDANSKAQQLSPLTRHVLLEGWVPVEQAGAPDSAAIERIEQELADGERIFERCVQIDSLSHYWEVRIVRLPDARRCLLRASLTDITERKQASEALTAMNSVLEARVRSRTADLQGAMETLRLTQKELVQSEKLSALGAMVAGIAHELNTPIGNSVLAASALSHHQQEFEQSMKGGITRSGFDRFLRGLAEPVAIIERNLARAAELVTGFKQVAIDRTTSQRRSFSLSEICAETVLTIAPMVRGQRYRINVNVAEGIVLDSYPGPLGQVLTNLISNAIVHGFDESGDGSIDIVASAAEGRVRIRVSDDGAGIAQDVQGRIFDPFFTTRMGRGGSGLGLHIVYNLVVGVLGGQIALFSAPGQGACFEIDLPCVAPQDDRAQWTTRPIGMEIVRAENGPDTRAEDATNDNANR